MNKEIKFMENNGVWELILLPEGEKLIGCKWIFTIKWELIKA